jgi:hypothetical protein
MRAVTLLEALGVAHVGPHELLHVGLHLPEVVAVMVLPLVEKVAHGKETHDLVVTGQVKLLVRQCMHHCYAVPPLLGELTQQRHKRSSTVIAFARHFHLVPRLQAAARLLEDLADAAVETAPLALQDMAQAFFGAPLAGRGMKRRGRFRQRFQLGLDRLAGCIDQASRLGRRKRGRSQG